MANNRGMGSVSWGQRKALRGIPYGTDPAYLLAQQQMQEEYNLMPERARLAEEKRQRDKAQEEADKARQAQGRGALVSAGGNVLAMDALSGFKGTRGAIGMGVEGYNHLMGNTSLPYQAAQQIADTGGTILTQTPGITQGAINAAPPVAGGVATGATNLGMNAMGDAGSLAGVTGESLAGTSIAGSVPAGASLGGAASAGMAAAPWAAAGYAAAKLGGAALEKATGEGESNVGSQFARTVQDPMAGIGRPWLKEMGVLEKHPWVKDAMNILNPIGFVEDKAGCIIVTACTDRNSQEVELTREYRDRFLNPDQLRGYYIIAETILPYVKKHKIFVKRILVDNLIEYGRYALDKTSDKPSLKSRIITRTFLCLCKAVGLTRKQFIRANGEVF
jgi:hypothetical protein